MKIRTIALGAAGLGAGGLLLKLLSSTRAGGDVPGSRKSSEKRALGLGAALLQRKSPLHGFNTYVVGFHPMKDDPKKQMVAHHYCRIVNEDFMQCILFDGSGPDAKLTGVEYILSEKLFESLPEDERPYWHPHNYEILSGSLVAPHLPERVERELMRRLMNSYGKTWHFWATGGANMHPDALPFGPPHLAWSFNRDGEADEEMIAERDRRLGISSQRRRELRSELASLAHPQCGVGLLQPEFPRARTAPPGVIEGAPPRA